VLPLQNLSTKEADHLTLQQLDRICDQLDTDIRWIVDEFDYLRAAGTSPRYCLDYDVLFPAIDALRNEARGTSEGEFWASLVLELDDFPVILLPGTLFEILSYARDRLEAVKRISATRVGSAFINSVAELDFGAVSETGTYHRIAAAFRDATISEQDFYLLSVIRKRASLIDAPLPEINRHLFYECLVELSRGTRVDKILNNRVDAYNYSLVAALNRERGSKHRYLLVSTSHFMRQLDTHAWHNIATSERGTSIIPQFANARRGNSKFQYRRNIIPPRRAAIFELLASAGGGIGGQSRQHAWELLTAINDAKTRIARVMAKARDGEILVSDAPGVRSDNVFLQLISSFVTIGSRIEKAHQQKRESIEIFSRRYDLRNPVDFFGELHEAIQKVLRDVGYRKALRQEIPRKVVSLKLVQRAPDERFTYKTHFDALATSSEIAFTYLGYQDGKHLFMSPHRCQLEGFMELYNVITREVFAKVAAKIYENLPHREDPTIVVGAGDVLAERPLDDLLPPLNLNALVDLFSVSREDINFVRVKQTWFDISYEDNVAVLSTPYPMIDEISFFLQETVKVGYRGANFKNLVCRLVAPTS
jgi:hypothetical protein